MDIPVDTARVARSLAALAGVKFSTYCANALKAFEPPDPPKASVNTASKAA